VEAVSARRAIAWLILMISPTLEKSLPISATRKVEPKGQKSKRARSQAKVFLTPDF